MAVAIQTLDHSPISGKVWLTVILVCMSAGMASVIWGWPLALVPLILLVALICIFQPSWGLYLLVGALFFPYAVWENPHTYPADLTLALVVLGFWLRRAREGRLGLVHTPADLPVVIWLAVLALSLISAYDLQRGLINWVRHLQLFLLFYVVAGLADNQLSRRLVGLLTAIAAILASVNLIPFIQSGGTARVYGVAGISFNAILTVVIVYSCARFCFERHQVRSKVYLGLFIISLLGQIANQSRAALGLAGVGSIIVLAIAWQWGRTRSISLPRLRARRIILVGVLTALMVMALGFPLLETVADRFQGLDNAGATLNLRRFIWKTAVDTYLEHPFFGIGLGQVQVWQYVLPSLRLNPLGPLTFGLGSHLSFLKYLAESGTPGALILLWLLAVFTRMGYVVIRRSKNLAQAGHEIGVSVVVFVIILSTFIEGHLFYAVSGMRTALFFGLLANIYTRGIIECDSLTP